MKVKVLKFDEELSRLSLGIKQLTENPWDKVNENIKNNDKVLGKVIGMNPGKGPVREKPGLKLRPEDMTDICCENCGGKYFRAVQAFKKVSALVSPTGKEQIVPIPVYRCDECGHINEEFLPKDA